jgi:CRAL/TRIO domain
VSNLAPKIFTVVFSMFKPFMTQSTIDKFRIFGTDKDEWIKALLEDIDRDQLPKHWGGTMIDPDGDPMCSSRVNT